MKIKYTITGELVIGAEVYKEYAQDGDQNWDNLTDEQKLELVRECESENNNEVIYEASQENGVVVINSIDLNS